MKDGDAVEVVEVVFVAGVAVVPKSGKIIPPDPVVSVFPPPPPLSSARVVGEVVAVAFVWPDADVPPPVSTIWLGALLIVNGVVIV
jgi:hypothetical protein